MRNLARVLPLVLLVTLVALLPAAVRAHGKSPEPAASAAAHPVLTAFVGPGYDIGIRDQIGDLRGRQIPAGTYQVRVHDYSEIHNFELKGDDVDEETDEEWVGQTTWTVTFRAGEEYEFECDPHHDFMYGEFSAGSAGPPPPPPPLPPPPPPPPGGGTLHATVRANATIDLKHPNGTPVTQLQSGSYAIQVSDQTSSHNFHLSGPGVNQSTSVAFTGATTWTVTLAAGRYSFVCDPHSDFMRGAFTVAAGPTPAAGQLQVSSLRVSRVGRTVVVRMRVNKKVAAQIRLVRKTRSVTSIRTALESGSNVKRVRIPTRAARGLYRVQVVFTDAGKRRIFTRSIRF